MQRKIMLFILLAANGPNSQACLDCKAANELIKQKKSDCATNGMIGNNDVRYASLDECEASYLQTFCEDCWAIESGEAEVAVAQI